MSHELKANDKQLNQFNQIKHFSDYDNRLLWFFNRIVIKM